MIGYVSATIDIVAATNYVLDRIENQSYRLTKLSGYELLVGHKGLRKIVVDMRKTPHLLISGLSCSGKSRCMKCILKNLQDNDNAEIVICNPFSDDYRGIHARRIVGEDSVDKYITWILETLYEREKPLYIVLEEMYLIRDKKLQEKIASLLCISRHYNVFVLGIIQEATKENCKYKSLFNTRITFRQIDTPSYQVVLGCSIEEKILNTGQFYLLSDDLYKGKTYIID